MLQARRRWPVVDTLVVAMDRFRIHRTGRNSALVSHYAFLSVFPLLLVFVTVLGFLLDGNPDLQASIIDSTLANFPIIGNEIAEDPTQLTGSLGLLIFGLLTATWSGLRAFNVLQTALDDIAEIPMEHRPTLVQTRLRSLLGIVLVGGGLVGAALLSGVATASDTGWVSRVLLVSGTLLLNGAVAAGCYRWLCSARPEWSEVLPGAAMAAFGFTLLQVVGTGLMTRAIVRATPIYGTFATVIGLLFWFGLHSGISLLGAELNGVVKLHRERTAARPAV